MDSPTLILSLSTAAGAAAAAFPKLHARLALTRAKARALRDALNIGICAVEELE